MSLIVVIIPLILSLLFLLPSSVKDQLILYHDTPNAISFFTTHFIHERLDHFLSSVIFYLILAISIYLLSQQAGQRRKFYLMMVLIFAPLPLLLSASALLIPTSETFLSLPASKSLGFSGVVSALFGFLPYFVLSYFKKSYNWKAGISGFLTIALFFSFGSILLSYPDPALHKIITLIIFWGLFFGLFIRAFRNVFLKACLSSMARTFEKNRFFRIIPIIYIFGLALLFPENIRIGKEIVGINVHLIGFAFGFFVSYFFVREEFMKTK